MRLHALLSLVTLAFAWPAHATTSSAVSASNVFSTVSGTNYVYIESSGTHHSGHGEAEASAAYGVLKTRGEAVLHFFTGNDNHLSHFRTSANAEARFFDSFVVGGYAAGTQGMLTFGISIAGEQSIAAAGAMPEYSLASTRWELRTFIGGVQRNIYRSVTLRSGGEIEILEGGFTGATPYETMYFTMPFVFGNNIGVDMRLIGSAATLALPWATDGQFAAAFELGNSVYWGGISAVTLADGTTLTDFTAIGTSGTDYSQSFAPVPEPATWLMLAVGAILLAVRRVPRA